MVARFAASLRTDNYPQPKEAQPLSHALTSGLYNILAPLMVRRWRVWGPISLSYIAPTQSHNTPPQADEALECGVQGRGQDARERDPLGRQPHRRRHHVRVRFSSSIFASERGVWAGWACRFHTRLAGYPTQRMPPAAVRQFSELTSEIDVGCDSYGTPRARERCGVERET